MSWHDNSVTCAPAYLGAGRPAPGHQRREGRPTNFADETGYLAKARVLTGGVAGELSLAGFYRGGYSLLLLPAYWIGDGPRAEYHGALATNALPSGASAAAVVVAAYAGGLVGRSPVNWYTVLALPPLAQARERIRLAAAVGGRTLVARRLGARPRWGSTGWSLAAEGATVVGMPFL